MRVSDEFKKDAIGLAIFAVQFVIAMLVPATFAYALYRANGEGVTFFQAWFTTTWMLGGMLLGLIGVVVACARLGDLSKRIRKGIGDS